VLISGGDAQSVSDDVVFSKLTRLRSANPLDGIVQVINSLALPDEIACDAFLRCRQKADYLLGWQAPVLLWLTDEAIGLQVVRADVATGVIF
ncbi:hypothetical protein, partial [Erwinia amylovora]|uniref:hypothetical protein n=1 Tax=Erwinia amylovora TaxID=552 RepID=UPI0034A22895|nr:IcmF-related protein [Erwinia amylovora]